MLAILDKVFTVKFAGFVMMTSAPTFYLAAKQIGILVDDSILLSTMLMTLMTSGANLIGLGTKTT